MFCSDMLDRKDTSHSINRQKWDLSEWCGKMLRQRGLIFDGNHILIQNIYREMGIKILPCMN